MIRLLLGGLFPLLFFLIPAYSQGTGIPPNESRTLEKPLPDVMLVDSEGRSFNLYSLKGKPLILSPIYTHCQSACPIITNSLLQVVYKVGKPGENFWVLSFSFDPKDTVEDLKRFKEAHSIRDIGWIVATGASKEDLFKLMDAIDFRFMTLQDSRDFIHPNLIVFISPDMKIKKYLYGVVFSEKDMKKAFLYAMGYSSLEEKLRPYMFFLGLLGFSASGFYIVYRLLART